MILSSSQLTIIISLFCSVLSSDEPHVSLTCVSNCTFVNNLITGGEEKTITLLYMINTTGLGITRASILDLNYDGSRIIQVFLLAKVIEKKSHPTFIDLSNTTLISTTYGYSFSFNVVGLNWTSHSGKEFEYTLSLGSRDETGTSTLDVLYGPYLLSPWTSAYNVLEANEMDIKFTLSGNPKPTVTALHMDESIEVGSSIGSSPYTYNVTLRNVNRDECGRSLVLKADGYAGPISYPPINITVLFTPGTPQMNCISQFKNCFSVSVSWTEIESGLCPVTYTLLYTPLKVNATTKTIRYNAPPLLEYCFNEVATTSQANVSIRAEVGGRNGSFSVPKTCRIHSNSKSSRTSSGVIACIIVMIVLPVFVGEEW